MCSCVTLAFFHRIWQRVGSFILIFDGSCDFLAEDPPSNKIKANLGAVFGKSSSDQGCCGILRHRKSAKRCKRPISGFARLAAQLGAKLAAELADGLAAKRASSAWKFCGDFGARAGANISPGGFRGRLRCVHLCARSFCCCGLVTERQVSPCQNRGLRRFSLLRFLPRSSLTFLYHRQ